MTQFTDSDGGVAQEFVQKLQALSSENSKGELSIERFLVKSEEAYFDKVRKDKLSSAASYISSHRDSIWSSHGLSIVDDRSRPASKCFSSCFDFIGMQFLCDVQLLAR